MQKSSKALCLGAVLSVGLMISGSALAQSEPAVASIKPPAWALSHPVANTVTLQGEGHAALMQKVQVRRQYQFADIRRSPIVPLGATKLDFTPLLNNPKAPANIAQRLRGLSQHVELQGASTEVTEIGRGLIVHDVIAYRIKPGKCNDPQARQQLETAGATCFNPLKPNARLTQLSTPGNPFYIADAAKRAKATAAYQQTLGQTKTFFHQHIANFRQTLSDPSKHAAAVAKLGAAEVQRLSALSDDQLEGEALNNAVKTVEQTLFIPNANTPGATPILKTMQIVPADAAAMKVQKTRSPGQAPIAAGALGSQIKSGRNNGNVATAGLNASLQRDQDFGPFIFLTGFTLGKQYEWSESAQFSIDPCFGIFGGCADTYTVKVFAGFDYGVGLRFPIQTKVEYHYNQYPTKADDASIKVDYIPIAGTPAQFLQSGLGQDQLFYGKEIVAEVKAAAGVAYHLPIIGDGGIGIGVGEDLTGGLPKPFTGGHFTPPAPGTAGINALTKVFDDFDLLGDEADFGFLAAHLYPAVKVDLRSDALKFTLTDKVANATFDITASGQTTSVGIANDASRSSHVSIGNPVYNLGFYVTPGVDARAVIDLDVWSEAFDWPIWFPQVAIELPPGGVDFSCHAGTICSRDIDVQGLIGKTKAAVGNVNRP